MNNPIEPQMLEDKQIKLWRCVLWQNQEWSDELSFSYPCRYWQFLNLHIHYHHPYYFLIIRVFNYIHYHYCFKCKLVNKSITCSSQNLACFACLILETRRLTWHNFVFVEQVKKSRWWSSQLLTTNTDGLGMGSRLVVVANLCHRWLSMNELVNISVIFN